MEKSVPSAKKKFSIRDIMTIAAMMVICFMKIRGFLRSVPTVLRHPLNTLEYAIVPMVFRSLKIADELSASAIVRGIESPYKKQSYYVSRISPLDAFLMLVSTAAGIVCCVLL